MADEYRGRVFSVYDMFFNAMFVAGAAIGAIFMPVTGHSLPMLITVAAGYLVAAAGYRLMSGQPPAASFDPGAGTEARPVSPGSVAGTPDSSAQRSSS